MIRSKGNSDKIWASDALSVDLEQIVRQVRENVFEYNIGNQLGFYHSMKTGNDITVLQNAFAIKGGQAPIQDGALVELMV